MRGNIAAACRTAHRTGRSSVAVTDAGHIVAKAVSSISWARASMSVTAIMPVVVMVVGTVPVTIIAPTVAPVRIPAPVGVIGITPVPIPVIAAPIGMITPTHVEARIVVPIEWVVTVGVDVISITATGVIVVVVAY